MEGIAIDQHPLINTKIYPILPTAFYCNGSKLAGQCFIFPCGMLIKPGKRKFVIYDRVDDFTDRISSVTTLRELFPGFFIIKPRMRHFSLEHIR